MKDKICESCGAFHNNANSDFCHLCVDAHKDDNNNSNTEQREDGMKTIDEQLVQISLILGNTKKFVPREPEHFDRCPCCKARVKANLRAYNLLAPKKRTLRAMVDILKKVPKVHLMYKGADCYACYTMKKRATKDYYAQPGNLSEDVILERHWQMRDVLGDEMYLQDWKQFNDRNTSKINTECINYGIDPHTMLTVAELEDINKNDAEYEPMPNDLIDHMRVDGFTRDQSIQKNEEICPTDSDHGMMVQLNGDSEKVFNVIISKEQKQLNYDQYVAKMKACKTLKELGALGRFLFNAIDASVRTFEIAVEVLTDKDKEQLKQYDNMTTEEFTKVSYAHYEALKAKKYQRTTEEISAPTFLPAGTYEQFWGEYAAIKHNLLKEQENAKQQFINAILEANRQTIGSVGKKLYDDLGNAGLSGQEMKEVWAEYRKVKSQLYAA